MFRRISHWLFHNKFALIGAITLGVIGILLPEYMIFVFDGMLLGALITSTLILKFFKVSRKLPYTWTCPREGCYYHIETSEGGEVMLLEVAEKHDHDHEIGLIGDD